MGWKDGLTGRVIEQGSNEYDEARRVFNSRFSKFPKLIVYCFVKEDASNAVNWARKHGISFSVRCGGHSYEAYSVKDQGLVIDISEILHLRVDKNTGLAQVGAGFRLMALYEALWKHKVTIPAGTCPSVGVSGLTLGGGYGILSRLFGMTCDSVTEIEMVNSQGKIIYLNPSNHIDLFWACRGAGDGSFGIVTSFTFRVHPINNIAYYTMTWNFSEIEKVIQHWQSWAPHTDSRLTSLLTLPADHQGDLVSKGLFVGLDKELAELLRSIQKNVPPKTLTVRSASWIEAVRLFAGRQVKQAKFKNTSAFAYEPLSDSAIGVIVNNLKRAPGPSNLVTLDAFGGEIAGKSVDATAFVHRKALFMLQYQAYWELDTDAFKSIQWVNEFRQSMLPSTKGAYRDYCDSSIPNWSTEYFAENIMRLKRIKERYDPENIFNYEQSIPRR